MYRRLTWGMVAMGLMAACKGEVAETGVPGSDHCAGAIKLVPGMKVTASLSGTGQEDLYSFEGTRGQVVMLDIDAQYESFNPEAIDAVITLSGPDGAQIAENNDPLEYNTHDSRLYTVLPVDGSYCVRVAECWTVATNAPLNCDAPKDKSDTEYTLYFYELVDEPGDPYTVDQEAGDDPSSATTVEYFEGTNGFRISNVWGTFRDQDDVDVFRFTLPDVFAASIPAGARASGPFYISTSGIHGSGATTSTGLVRVVDPNAPDVALAELDGTKNNLLMPPLEVGKEYWLFVTRHPGLTGNNDFYFIRHHPGWGNPVEVEAAGASSNDAPEGAEPLTMAEPSKPSFFVEGNLDLAAGDGVDHFAATIPSGAKKVSAACAAWRAGSGLRGLTIRLDEGRASAETEDVAAGVEAELNNAQGVVVLQVKAEAQAPHVSGTYYRCGVHFSD